MRIATPARTPPESSVRRRALPAFLLALVPYALLVYRFNYVCDDAFISFRYAKHLAAGEGLRYNPGGPAIEGFSNLLWVLILTPFEAAGWTSVVWSRVVSIACGVLLAWRLTRFLAVRWNLRPDVLVLASAFFTTLPPIAVWSTGGLETMPFALTLFLAYELLLVPEGRVRGLVAGLAFAVLIVVRAEGFLWAAFLFLLTCVTFRPRKWEVIRPFLLAGAIAGVTLAVLTAFRLLYFGSLLPNPAHAKMGVSAMYLERGAKYSLNFVLTFPALALILIAGTFRAWNRRLRSPELLPAAGIALAIVGYSLVVGGDFMPMGRFFVPALPFLAILFGDLLKGIGGTFSRSTAVALGSLAIGLTVMPAFDVHLVPHSLRKKTDFRWNLDTFQSEYAHWVYTTELVAKWTELGHALAEHTQPGESLPRVPIGAVGYYSRLTLYDQAGLVDPEVARLPAQRRGGAGHDRIVPKSFFLKYNPTYFHVQMVRGLEGKRLDDFIDNYYRRWSPKILARYARVKIPLEPLVEGGPRRTLVLLRRRDLGE